MSRESRQQSVERRKYYRIDDVVLLRFDVLEEGLPGPRGGGVQSGTEELLAQLDSKLNRAVNAVWPEHPMVAEALGLLNRKLTIIAATLEHNGRDDQSYADTRVNLSGCGLAFEVEEGLDIGTRLHLSIILQPSQITVPIAGTVVDCLQLPGSSRAPCQIRVDFDEDIQAQEQIIQHVVQKHAALRSGRAGDVS